MLTILTKKNLFFIIIASAILCFTGCDNKHADYEEVLKNHPYYSANNRVADWENINKRDRPDLAWEQNFLMTMDPRLKRPAPERLSAARAQMQQYFKAKSNARTGTEEFPWIERGPDNVGGRTRGIAWDPNDNSGQKVWAGSVTGGLWYTDNIYDENETWKKVNDFWDNLSITSIAFDPNNTNIIYAGTGEGWGAAAARGAGIWKSTDGGSSWSPLSATKGFFFVNDLLVRDENGTSVLYAGLRGNYYQGWHALNNQGLQRSTDGGSSFSQVMPDISGENYPFAIADLELAADNKLWAASTNNAYGGGGGTILYSENGTTWTIATERDGTRVELACAPSDANYLYALIEKGGKVEEVIKSTDAGATWTSVSEPNDDDTGIPADDFSRGQAWYDLILVVDPKDPEVVLAGAIDLFRTSNGGSSWQQISHWYGGFGYPYLHADHHAIVYKPGSSSDVIFGNDGGMAVSTTMDQNTPSFIVRNHNYNITQFYAAAIHPDAAENYFLAGSQDNGTQKFTQAGLGSTTEPTGGDGAFCFIDQKNGDIQITSYVHNSYYLSADGGQNFEEISDDQNTGRFINPADYDDNKGILYTSASETSIGRFTDIKTNKVSRNDLSVNLGTDASHLRVSPYTTNSSTLYVGTGAGKLYKIENADASGSSTEITGSSFPEGNISCVEIGASEDELLVTFSNYGVTSIWQTSDGGNSWSSREGNLPDMPVRWALCNPNNRSEVILATDLGVWRTEDITVSSPTWVPSNIGLANVRVDMLQIRDSDHEVIAATHGRGLYSSSGFSAGSSNTITANFSVSTSQIQPGESVDFTDISTGAPVSWEWTFEGGTPATSTDQNPTVSYASAGTYDVTLTVTDADGNTNTKSSTDLIEVSSSELLPNLAAYQPQGWAASITVSNVEDDYDNDRNLSVEDDLYLSYALVNNGDADIEQDFNVSVLLDGLEILDKPWVFDSSDPFLATYFISHFNIEMGALDAGNHTITIVLDHNEALEEKDESDNEYEYTFHVQNSCVGDQTFTESSGSFSDGSGDADYLDNRSCRWIIEPENAGSITLSFSAFDIEEDYDFVNIFAGSDEETSLDSLTGSTLPDDMTINEGKVVVEFISDGSVGGSGWELSYTSTIVYPDVALSEFTATENGGLLDLSLTVSNLGQVGLVEGVELNFYLSEDDEWSADDEFLDSSVSSALEAESSEEITLAPTMPDLSSGQYHVIAVADENSELEEEDETNNEATASFEIIVLKSGLSSTLQVYPNPISDQLNVVTQLAGHMYVITNLSGQVVRQGTLKNENRIDMKSLAKGMYVLSIKTDKGHITRKLRKLH